MRNVFAIFSSVAVLCAFALPIQARNSMAIQECGEIQTCDAEGNCINANTRVVLADMMASEIPVPYLSIGPLVPEAGGGLFMDQNWRWNVGDLPLPSDAVGRSYLLSRKSDGGMLAHVFREGGEISGLSAKWVRSDFDCKQVMF